MAAIYRLTLCILVAVALMALAWVGIFFTTTSTTINSTSTSTEGSTSTSTSGGDSVKDDFCYTAAVLDHRRRHSDDGDPAKNIELNFEVYSDAISKAKQHNVDLIVFPESSLGMPAGNRSEALKYSEYIPEPGVNPCTANTNRTKQEVPKEEIHRRLSCLARENKMFVAAQLLDRQRCRGADATVNETASIDPCPDDDHYVFNGAVLFDRNGTILLRYHKIQLFGEMSLNPGSPETDPRYVDTELGRLAIQICFDMIYEKPGHYLAREHSVDTIIFPTQWFNEAPFLSASQYQLAWAIGNRVNLLASNGHRPFMGSMGSGIYTGGNGSEDFVAANFVDNNERLVIGSVPKKPRSGKQCQTRTGGKIVELDDKPNPEPTQYRFQQMNLTSVDSVLVNFSSTKEIKEIDFQISFDFVTNNKNDTEEKPKKGYFVLKANRTRVTEYPWTEEFCALAWCEISAEGKCGRFVADMADQGMGIQTLILRCEFEPDTVVYPSVVGHQHQPLIPGKSWQYKRINDTHHDIQINQMISDMKPISVVGLYGRNYVRDPEYKQVPIHVNPQIEN